VVLTSRLEEEDGHLPQIEVDEMLRLMSDVAAEVPPNNTMPCPTGFDSTVCTSHLLYVGRNVLLYIVLLHGLGSTVHCILLHVLRHVSILDYCLPVSHDACKQEQNVTTNAKITWRHYI
uniref:Uncharacterized protein n=1 Tax=Hucho hucho TaxID=62062 RepID=A0A4W5MDU4_9TELE